MSDKTPILNEVAHSLDKGRDIIIPDTVTSPAPQEAAQADANAIIVEFRQEWLKRDSGVLDAWYDPSAGAIKCLVDINAVSQGDVPKVQRNYKGMPTELTMFGRA